MRHGLSTAEAALDGVGRVGVGEHDEGVADRQVSPIARYREKGSNLPLRKAEEPSPSSGCNFVHVFMAYSISAAAACCWYGPEKKQKVKNQVAVVRRH